MTDTPIAQIQGPNAESARRTGPCPLAEAVVQDRTTAALGPVLGNSFQGSVCSTPPTGERSHSRHSPTATSNVFPNQGSDLVGSAPRDASHRRRTSPSLTHETPGLQLEKTHKTGQNQIPPHHPPLHPTPRRTHPGNTILRNGKQTPTKRTRATLKVATLNIRGTGSSETEYKWRDLNSLMKTENISVLTLQETHTLNQDKLEKLNKIQGYRMKIFHSPMPDHPNSAGIAIVINKYTTRWKEASYRIIIPGRAMLLYLPWCKNDILTALAIYAPNDSTSNKSFWKKIQSEWITHNLPKPDLLMGDFNMVEHDIDRLPVHLTHSDASDEFSSLTNHLEVEDTWRNTHGNCEGNTWINPGNKLLQSRIDRIYMNNSVGAHAHGWETTPTIIKTDHRMVSTKIYHPNAPYVGPGRWTLPLPFLKDHTVISLITKSGRKALEEMEAHLRTNCNTEEHDNTKIQLIYRNWKDNMLTEIRNYLHTKIPKINAQINALKRELKLLNKAASPNSNAQTIQKGIISKEIEDLSMARHLQTRTSMEVNGWIHREVIRKFWISENKEQKPRDTFYRLQKPGSNPTEYSTSTKEMCEIARTHHNSIQTNDLPTNEENRRETMNITLHHTPPSITEEDRKSLQSKITEEEIEKEILHLPRGKAPGLDGLPHEFWKSVADRHRSKVHAQKAHESFDIIRLLSLLYNNIADEGMRKHVKFAEGWMCPLYKKKDKTNIENYRPVTVLNADYKILTRILTVRLANAAPKMIHPDQAGFMPGRRIEDQTDLIHMIIEKCELQEENGALIFLDQEKAYDKIRHDYLWTALRKQNIPETFINIVQSLYTDAHTQILLNGTLSNPYKITRGVRQGDPLSCLLFNFAIEPLARTLRASDLEGIKIKGQTERLIATLFADDTTVYLSHKDDLGQLAKILDEWCRASGAKFNIEKSIILPLGTNNYKKEVYQSRRLSPTTEPAKQGIHIMREGESTRVLGAYVGIRCNQLNIWKPLITTIQKNLERWSRSNPTQEGRRLIVNMEIGGRTQYLARVQGMPDEISKTLSKMTSKFIWNDSHPTINEDTIRAPIRMGGKKVIDIKSRNEAIELRRYQRWCEPNESERPRWAYAADEVLTPNIKAYNNIRDEHTIILPPLQNFTITLGSRTAPIPEQLLRILKIKQKYNVLFDPPALSENLKLSLPIWHHISQINRDPNEDEETQTKRHIDTTNQSACLCLRKTHGIQTVQDVVKMVQRLNNPEHKPRRNCKCRPCHTDTDKGCKNPNTCIKKCSQLLTSLPTKYRPSTEIPHTPIALDPIPPIPNATPFSKNPQATSLRDGFRVFCQHKPNHNPVPHHESNGINPENDNTIINVYTDGSCLHNGSMEAKAGAGVWYAPTSNKNKSIRLNSATEQSNNAGELIGILDAIMSNINEQTLNIHTDSQYAIDNLTKLRKRREDEGWINSANRDILKKIIAALRHRPGHTYFSKVKGHSGIAGNEGADKLAQIGAQKPSEDIIDISIPNEYNINGARLIGMSQALLYRGIRELKEEKLLPRRKAVINLDMTRWAAKEKWGEFPTDTKIWNAIRDRTLDRKIRAFLYKHIHGTLKIGHYWDNIPNHEKKGECNECGTVESLEHIMTECTLSGQSTVWKLARYTLEQRDIDISNITISDMIASPLAAFKLKNGKPNTSLNRLYKIIITESLYTIWLIRCEWRFDRETNPEKSHTKQEIRTKWLSRINRRIRIDQALARNRELKWKRTPKRIILQTWQNTLQNESLLPEDWSWMRGVLVGTVDGKRPRGRNR